MTQTGPEVLTQHDGAEWHRYELAGGCSAVLTSRGRELFESRPGITDQVRAYMDRALGKTAVTDDGIRKFFDEGTNSKIYTLGPDLLVKETHAHSMWRALQRMDRICTAVEKYVPRWLSVPDYYGLLEGNGLPDDFVLMERVNSGINVHHIIEPEELSELERQGVEASFGPVTDAERAEVTDRYIKAKQLLDQALADDDLIPSEYLTDWSTENVLVERLTTPVAESRFRLSVIDQ